MKLSERLDAQLSARLAAGPASVSRAPADTTDTLSQLQAADALLPWRSAIPRPGYADALEARLLAHAAAGAVLGARQISEAAPNTSAVSRHASASSWRPAVAFGSRRSDGGSVRSGSVAAREAVHSPLLRSLVAATVALFALGAGVVLAAASAGPGSPLYGLHRVEQNVRVSLSSSPAERVRLRLAYAQADLAAIDHALARHETGATYTDALGAFQGDLQAIEADMPALTPGAERDQLAARVAALQSQGRSDLLRAVPTLSWPNRLKTTTVLGSLGAPVPTVAQATVTRTLGSGDHETLVVIVGANFQQGAVIEVNGDATGTVVSQTSSQLVVRLDPNFPVASAKYIGVSNPDGTAAETAHVILALNTGTGKGPGSGNSPTAGPGATATSSPGNGNGNGGGHPGGGSHGTPTPSH